MLLRTSQHRTCCVVLFFRLPLLHYEQHILQDIKIQQIAQKGYLQKIMQSPDEKMPPFLSLQNLLLEFNVCLDFVFNNLIGTKCTISKGESNEKYICKLKSFRHVNFVAPKMQSFVQKMPKFLSFKFHSQKSMFARVPYSMFTLSSSKIDTKPNSSSFPF